MAYSDAYRRSILDAMNMAPDDPPAPGGSAAAPNPYLDAIRAGIAPAPSDTGAMGAAADAAADAPAMSYADKIRQAAGDQASPAGGASMYAQQVANLIPDAAPTVNPYLGAIRADLAAMPRRGAMSPDALADNGAGGAPAQPAPVSRPEDGGFSAPPANVSVPPPLLPETPAPTPDPNGAGGAGGASGASGGGSAGGEPGGGSTLPPRGRPDAVGPAGAPVRPVDPRDEEDQRVGAEYESKVAKGTPGTRVGDKWNPNARSMEGKVIDPSHFEAWETSQANFQGLNAMAARARSDSEEKAREIDKLKRTFVDPMADAAQARANIDHARTQAGVTAEIDAQRKKLANPNDFWESKGDAYRVRTTIFMALEGALQGASGQKIEPGKWLDQAVKEHTDAQMRKLGFLGQKKDENEARFAHENAVREGIRQAGYRAVDDQVKDELTRGANPIVREIVFEDVPGEDPDKDSNIIDRTAAKVAAWFRAKGHEVAPDLIAQIAPDRPLTAVQRQAHEVTWSLIPEIQTATEKLAAARERLDLDGKLAPTQKADDKFTPAHTVGGKAGDPEKAHRMRLDRARDRRENRKLDIDERDATTRESEAAGRSGEKVGGRMFVRTEAAGTDAAHDVDYVARPGTPEVEMTKIRQNGAALKGLDAAIVRMQGINNFASVAKREEERRAIEHDFAMAVNVLGGNGAMSKDEGERYGRLLSPTNLFTSEGVDAAKQLAGLVRVRHDAHIQQVGGVAVPRK